MYPPQSVATNQFPKRSHEKNTWVLVEFRYIHDNKSSNINLCLPIEIHGQYGLNVIRLMIYTKS